MKKDTREEHFKEEVINTIIGKGTYFEGSIKINQSCRVDGTVKGKIASDQNIVIGETGFVDGTIVSDKVIISGKVLGQINAKSSAVLKEKAEFDGELKTAKIKVSGGAIFNGKSEMLKKTGKENPK